MNNDDKERFAKLYELLGEEVNSIYDTKKEDEIFVNDQVKEEIKPEPFSKEIYIEPTKIKIKKDIIKKKEKNNFNELSSPFDNSRGKEIKDKSNNNKEIKYDEDYDADYKNNNIIINILSNKKTLYLLMILIFIFVCILTIKAFHFGKIKNNYNEYKKENDIKVYSDRKIDSEAEKKGSALELVECLSSPIDIDGIPDNISSIIRDINKFYRSSNDYFAFAYKDIFTGFTVSYNENGNIFAASTIKAPANIYIYEMASQDKINLDEEMTYTSYYYNNGTGVLKNKSVNTNYTVRELSMYAIRNSDNAAHNMLMDKYGRNNMREFWNNLGTNVIFTGSDNWGMINAHDAAIYMSELYRFYLEDQTYGEELMNNFINAKTKFISGKNNYIVANKTGWSGNSQHDAAIIFADNPYIVVALSNLGYNENYMYYFNRVNDLAYNLHTEYWNYKMQECNLNK